MAIDEDWKMNEGNSLRKLSGINILVIQKMGTVGGAEKNLERILGYFMNKFSFNATIYGPGEGPFFREMDLGGVPTVRGPLPDWRKGKSIIFRYLARRKMILSLSSRPVDLVYVNDFFYAPYGVALGKAMKCPVVVHIQSDSQEKRVSQYHLNQADAVIVTTKSTYDRLKPSFSSQTILEYIPNGVPSSNNYLNDLSRHSSEMPPQSSPIKFGIVANILPHKGIECMMHVMEELKEIDGWELHWAGNDPQSLLPSLKVKIESMNLSGRVFFHGFIDRMDSFYESLDCLIHPSQFEPFGLAMIEAMSYGIPVLATATEGGKEILGSVENGQWLVPVDDWLSITERLKQFISNPSLLYQSRSMFRDEFEKKYDFDVMGKKLEDIFSRVLRRFSQ